MAGCMARTAFSHKHANHEVPTRSYITEGYHCISKSNVLPVDITGLTTRIPGLSFSSSVAAYARFLTGRQRHPDCVQEQGSIYT